MLLANRWFIRCKIFITDRYIRNSPRSCGFMASASYFHTAIWDCIVFFLFVLILVISIGTLMYMIEGQRPGTAFDNIPNSIYWAIVTMTTVGYGDITPETPLGRFLSAVVMLIGYTIIAVPTGIVSASMMKEHRRRQVLKCPHCGRDGHEEGAAYCKYCGGKLE